MRNILVFLGGIAVVLVVAVGLYQWLGKPTVKVPQERQATAAAPAGATSGQSAATVRADDFVMGSASAPVTIIEYASLTCPHCRHFHEEVLPKLKSAYIDTGKLRLVFRDFPLDRLALRASMLARCSGRERYFGFLGVLFKRQVQWATSSDPLAALGRVAALGGMSAEDFKACLNNKEIETKVLEQRQEAEKVFGVDSTPSFILNGQKLSVGATVDDFKAVIDPLVAKAGK